MLAGAGIGLALASISNAIVESVPAQQTVEAISVTIARTVGSRLGTAVIAAVITSHSTPQGLPGNDAFTIGLWVCGAVAVLAVLGTIASPSMTRRQQALALGIEDLPDEAAEFHLLHTRSGHNAHSGPDRPRHPGPREDYRRCRNPPKDVTGRGQVGNSGGRLEPGWPAGRLVDARGDRGRGEA